MEKVVITFFLLSTPLLTRRARTHDLRTQFNVPTFDFKVLGRSGRTGYMELCDTLSQDFTVCRLMQEQNIDVWREKLDRIVANGGMALFLTHPDYMNMRSGKCGIAEFPVERYEQFLVRREKYI